jgi:hypothetical protein
LSGSSANPITVQFDTADSTAVAGQDYSPVSRLLTFNPGQGLIQTVTVTVLGDRLHESTEYYKVRLTNPTNARLGDGNGVGTILDNDLISDVTAGANAIVTGLREVIPNPFAGRAVIRFGLREGGPVDLTAFDVQGRSVRRLDGGTHPPGEAQVIWDGRDRDGNRLPSGIYLLKLTTGGRTYTRAIHLVR